MPMPTPDEVRLQLSAFGVKIDNFNQSESGRAFGGADLKDGYCEGVSLDWIRRVLQRGRPSFSANMLKGSNPDYDFLRKKQSQAERQAHAHLNWVHALRHYQEHQGPAVRTNLQNEWRQTKNKAIAIFDELEDDLFKLINNRKAQAQVELTPITLSRIQKCFGRSIGKMQNVNTIEQLYSAIPDKKEIIYNKTLDHQVTEEKVRNIVRENAWNDFSIATDKRFPKKRSFENVSLLSSSPRQQGVSLNSVISKLSDVGTNDLKSNRAVRISIGGKQGGRDFFHSTASYLDPALQNPYLFLDPNYGIFAYPEWKFGVMKAIAILYTMVYTWIEGKPDRNVPFTNFDLQIEVFGRRT